jgi:hypothetical protein
MKRKKRIECFEGRHKDCGGWIDRVNFGERDQPCQCACHFPNATSSFYKELRKIDLESKE